jgi:uncharacterized protein YbdZ (MbtH family)
MTNPFEDSARTYVVLVNEEGQHSLWPDRIAVPDGWSTAHGPAGRDVCLEYITTHWTDMRPLSLRAQMDATA